MGAVKTFLGAGFGGLTGVGGVSALTGSGWGFSIGLDSTFGLGLGRSTIINSIGSCAWFVKLDLIDQRGRAYASMP